MYVKVSVPVKPVAGLYSNPSLVAFMKTLPPLSGVPVAKMVSMSPTSGSESFDSTSRGLSTLSALTLKPSSTAVGGELDD